MITFIIGIAILIIGYFVWGKIAERIFKPDNRLTPAIKNPDGVEKVPLSEKKNMFLQLLNIAGLGPILGVALGIKFGPIVFLLLPIGNVIGGAIHDYFIGMISVRNNGSDFSSLIQKFLGKKIGVVFTVIMLIALILLVANFTNSPAHVINSITLNTLSIGGNAVILISIVCILVYYVLSSLFSIDKIIGKIYPYIGLFLLIVTLLMIGFMIPSISSIPDVTFTPDGLLASLNQHPDGQPILPMLFITITCGILSGFHATQTPIVSRTIRTEKSGRRVFYGMMILEGIIAMIWAAAVSILFTENPSSLAIGTATNIITSTVFFIFPAIIAAASLVLFLLLGISSGDTGLRVARTSLANLFHFDQKKALHRVFILTPLIVVIIGLIIEANLGNNTFDILWSYFSWFNQIMASFALIIATIYLITKGKKWLITAIPGAFITFICITYILWINPEKVGGYVVGFGLPLEISYIISIILTLGIMAAAVLHGYKLRKQSDFKPETDPKYPENNTNNSE